MAFDKTPTSWIPGIAYDSSGGGKLTIPLSSIPQLTASEITGPDADIRKIYFALCETLHRYFADKPVADRPAYMGASKTYSPSIGFGPSNRFFGFGFTIDIDDVEIAPEP
jgi:hypothetical protein